MVFRFSMNEKYNENLQATFSIFFILGLTICHAEFFYGHSVMIDLKRQKTIAWIHQGRCDPDVFSNYICWYNPNVLLLL